MSSAPDWSVEAELKRFAGSDSVEDAIIELGLAPSGNAPYKVQGLSPPKWERGGAETYLYVFQIKGANKFFRRYLLKAYLSIGGGTGEPFRQTLIRRKMLNEAGAKTPRLYAYHQDTTLEDYIPLTLDEALDRASMENLSSLVSDVLATADALDQCEFRPIAWLRDMLSDGEHAYIVDFGNDLGGAGAAENTGANRMKAEAFLWERLPEASRSLLDIQSK